MTNRVKIFLISFLLLMLIVVLIIPVSCKVEKEEIPIHLVISKEEIDEGLLRGKIEDLNLTAEEINDKCSSDYSGNIEVAGIAESLKLNYEETQILHFINFNRTNNGLNTVLPNEALSYIAGVRSSDMLNRNYFSHYTPEGKNVFDILKENNIEFKYAGENLARSSPPKWGSPEAIVIAWMNSPTHRENILRPVYAEIGIRIVDENNLRVITTVYKQ